jgi:TraY domain
MENVAALLITIAVDYKLLCLSDYAKRQEGTRSMPRTSHGTDWGKRYPLNMRTTKETRDRLEAAAAASGRSLAQEVEHRLEQSFSGERETDFLDRLLQDPDCRFMAQFLLGRWWRGCKDEAEAAGHPEWTPAEWMQHSGIYQAGANEVIHALSRRQK